MSGVGFDWPIGYEDLAPYYDKAERLIGVTGRAEGLRSAPDGIFQTPAPFKPHEHLVDRACAKLGIKATQLPPGGDHEPAQRARRPASTAASAAAAATFGSNYASSYVQIFPAMQTGRVTVLANAMARELVTDASGKVTAVLVHRQDHGRGTPGALPHRGAVGRGVRVGAPAPELEVVASSPRHRQLGRHGRQVPDRHRRVSACRPPCRTCAACRRSRPQGYGAHIYMPWWMADRQQRTGLPARLPRRGRRRWVCDPEPGLRRGGLQPERRLRPADEAGHPRGVRQRDQHQPQRPRIHRARTRTATARSIRTVRRTSGASRCCASTGSGATTS